MGRAAVIVLALANLGYFAWSAGALAAFDMVPANLAAHEPHRLARQLRPERLRIVTPEQERQEARVRAEAAAQAEAQAQAQDRMGTEAPGGTAASTAAESDPALAASRAVTPTR